MTTRRGFKLLVFALAGVVFAQNSTPEKKPREYADPEAYAIYSSVLTQMIPKGQDAKSPPVPTLVSQVPMSPNFDPEKCFSADHSSEEQPYIDAYRNLIAQDAKAWTFSDRLRSVESVQLLSRAELDELFALPPVIDKTSWNKLWDKFHARYPNSRGYSSFSLVGFDQSRKFAALEQRHSCGSLCGGASARFFRKDRVGTWVEQRTSFGCLSIS